MDYLEIIGTIIGVIYLILEYRANKLLWIAGFIMPAIYVVVYFRAGLYADFGINVYYLIASVYGMLMWYRGAKNDSGKQAELPVVNTPRSNIIPLVAVFAATFVVIAFILDRFTDSDVVIADSFTTALSIVGMWMLARKYLEQWLVWIAVDVVSSVLYIYKELYFTSALYALYTIIAIFGYFKWRNLMKYGNN